MHEPFNTMSNLPAVATSAMVGASGEGETRVVEDDATNGGFRESCTWACQSPWAYNECFREQPFGRHFSAS